MLSRSVAKRLPDVRQVEVVVADDNLLRQSHRRLRSASRHLIAQQLTVNYTEYITVYFTHYTDETKSLANTLIKLRQSSRRAAMSPGEATADGDHLPCRRTSKLCFGQVTQFTVSSIYCFSDLFYNS